MDELLQELSVDTTKISRDVSGTMVSPIDVIAALLGQNPFNVKRKYGACCIGLAKTKLVGVRNSKEAGDAATIKRVLCACSDPRIKAICQKTWPAEIVPMDVAPESTEEPRGEEIESAHTFVSEPNQLPSLIAPAVQALNNANDVDGALADNLQDDDDMINKDHFDFVPAQMVEFVLELNGSKFNIPVRRDGYVNVTKICQAAGKRLDHYKESQAGKEYMKYLQNRNLAKSDTRNPGIALLISIKGGNINTVMQGTFAHPDLAMAIAMWAHPPFLAEVTSWIQELLITGRVELGKEKSPEEVNEKLEETFQTVDEDKKLYLREKRRKELLALDEDQEAKRAKRHKNEERKQMAFEKEMQEKEAKTARDKEEHDNRLALVKRNENIALVQNSLDFGNNAHLIALWNDIKMDVLNQIKKQVTGECFVPQETKFCDDVTTIGKKLGFANTIVEQHRSALGKAVAKEYRKRFNEEPPVAQKYVNGNNRKVNTYGVEHQEWIEEVVRDFLADNVSPPPSTRASQASQKGIKAFLTTM